MDGEIVAVLEESPYLWSASAIGWRLGRPPHGSLGQDPDPEMAEALTHLVAAGEAVRVDGCPVCRRVGVLYAAPAHAPTGVAERAEVPWQDAQEAIEPLIAEGLVEVGETVELDVRECCARTTRPWRKAPPPA